MKGSTDVIQSLNQAAGLEATLNEQYRLDARALKALGLKMKKKMEDFGCDTSDYRRAILDRIYALDGVPNYTIGSPVNPANVTAMLQNELKMELEIAAPGTGLYEQWAIDAWQAKDDNTRNLYEHWLKWHQNDHIVWLEKQIGVIDAIGEPAYIAEIFK